MHKLSYNEPAEGARSMPKYDAAGIIARELWKVNLFLEILSNWQQVSAECNTLLIDGPQLIGLLAAGSEEAIDPDIAHVSRNGGKGDSLIHIPKPV